MPVAGAAMAASAAFLAAQAAEQQRRHYEEACSGLARMAGLYGITPSRPAPIGQSPLRPSRPTGRCSSCGSGETAIRAGKTICAYCRCER